MFKVKLTAEQVQADDPHGRMAQDCQRVLTISRLSIAGVAFLDKLFVASEKNRTR